MTALLNPYAISHARFCVRKFLCFTSKRIELKTLDGRIFNIAVKHHFSGKRPGKNWLEMNISDRVIWVNRRSLSKRLQLNQKLVKKYCKYNNQLDQLVQMKGRIDAMVAVLRSRTRLNRKHCQRKAFKASLFIEKSKTSLRSPLAFIKSSTKTLHMKSGRPLVAHLNTAGTVDFYIDLLWRKKFFVPPLGKGAFKTVWEYFDYQRGKHDQVLTKRRPGIDNCKELYFYRHLQGIPQIPSLSFVFIEKDFFQMMMDKYESLSPALFRPNAKNFLNLKKRDELKIFTKIVQGCVNVHRRGVVHRDLKFENILYNYTLSTLGRKSLKIKIADFDLSCFISNHSKLLSRVGTSCYMAPECIALEEKTDPLKMDCWSLGVMLYRLYFKKMPPFAKPIKSALENNRLTPAARRNILVEEVRKLHHSLADRRPKEPWIDLMLKLLEPDVKKRLSSEELLFQCRKLLQL